MKFLNIMPAVLSLLVFIFINCIESTSVDYRNRGPVPLTLLSPNPDFGNINVNGSSPDHVFLIIANDSDDDFELDSGTSHNQVINYYKDIKVRISINDSVNFTLKTSMTDFTIKDGQSTDFYVKFNPKSAGVFTAVISVDVIGTDKSYSAQITGTGVL